MVEWQCRNRSCHDMNRSKATNQGATSRTSSHPPGRIFGENLNTKCKHPSGTGSRIHGDQIGEHQEVSLARSKGVGSPRPCDNTDVSSEKPKGVAPPRSSIVEGRRIAETRARTPVFRPHDRRAMQAKAIPECLGSPVSAIMTTTRSGRIRA